MPITTRMTVETAEHHSDPDTHLGRLVAYAFQLGTRPHGWNSEQQKADWHDTWGRLRRWTHMLGFGGHFATKIPPLLDHPQDPARRPPDTGDVRSIRNGDNVTSSNRRPERRPRRR